MNLFGKQSGQRKQGLIGYVVDQGLGHANMFNKPQQRRAPIVHSESDDARVVLYDDNSMGGVAARANANAIYGSQNVGGNFARRPVIEVKGPDGTWMPVNQINPGGAIGEQIAALSVFRETGKLAGLEDLQGAITSSNLPGGQLQANASSAIQLAKGALFGQAEENAGATVTSSDFKPTRAAASSGVGAQAAARGSSSGPGPMLGQNRTNANSATSPATQLTGNMGDYARAISVIESGSAQGNYRAMGKVMESGSYKGDRAYGRYQVMGRNIPSWTREAIGREMTPAEFLADDRAQDAVFAHKFQKSIDRYGSPQDAASVWFTGRPASDANAQNASDGNINGAEYVRRFNKNLGGSPAATATADPTRFGAGPGAHLIGPGQNAVSEGLQPYSDTAGAFTAQDVQRMIQDSLAGAAGPGAAPIFGGTGPTPSLQPVETLTGGSPTMVERDGSGASLIDRAYPSLYDPRPANDMNNVFRPTRFLELN